MGVRATLILAVCAVVVTANSSYAYDDSGSGIINKIHYVTADNLISIPGYYDFTDVSNMSVTAKSKGTVIVDFCAATNTGGFGSVGVTLAVDGENVPYGMDGSGGVQFSASSARLPHCFTWVVPNLEPGNHTFSMLWRKYGSTLGYMQSRTLTVKELKGVH